VPELTIGSAVLVVVLGVVGFFAVKMVMSCLIKIVLISIVGVVGLLWVNGYLPF